MDKTSIIYERLKRQRLLEPLADPNDIEGYKKLFRLLQPVAPIFFSRPGNPPQLVHRTTFDDSIVSGHLREKKELVKGRFQGGRVGYVLEEDLNMYAGIFQKTLKKVNALHEEIMATIKNSGGISKDQLKEELPYAAKDITNALKKLHEAFLVYEDQIDTDWNTGWFDFSTEWFNVELKQGMEAAVSEMLLNFLDSFVFGTLDQIKSWSQLRINLIKNVLNLLLTEERIVKLEITGLGEGYMRKEDINIEHHKKPHTIFMLDKSDFLVRSYMNDLKEAYRGLDVLQFLLIDGEFKGAVLGHWRIGPHDIEDVVLHLDLKEVKDRKTEIMKAIRMGYSTETTEILRYNGEALKSSHYN